MSTPNDLRDLAIRITRLPGWHWMPGMVLGGARGQVRILSDQRHTGEPREVAVPDVGLLVLLPNGVGEWCPDLTDPATAGCLLALLGEDVVTNHESRRGDGTWTAHVRGLPYRGVGQTLGEACARAALALGRWPGGVE